MPWSSEPVPERPLQLAVVAVVPAHLLEPLPQPGEDHYLLLVGHHLVDIQFLGKVFGLEIEEI